MKIFEIKCRFCGKKLGDIKFQNLEAGTLITPEMAGISDARCEADKVIHGDRREMFDQYIKEFPDDVVGFEKMLAESGYTKQNFDGKLQIKIANK